MAIGISKAKSALRDAMRILETTPGQVPGSQRVILEAAQRRARDAAFMVVSAQDRASSKLWADASLVIADCAFRLGEPDVAMGAMLGSAAVYMRFAHGNQDADVANAAFALSRAYSRLGDGKRAAVFAAETFRRTPRRERNLQRNIWCLAALIAAGDHLVVAEWLAELPTHQLTEPDASMFLILKHVSGRERRSLADLLRANERITEVPAEAAVLFRLTVAAELRAAGQPTQARGILQLLLKQLAAEAAPPWTLARVRQVVADILLSEQHYHDALSAALASWVVLDECRYRTGSARLRRTIHDSYALARRTAMSAAAALQNWALLSELIESARLQSGSDIEGSLAEFDSAADGHQVTGRARRGDTRTINLDDVRAPYSLVYDDLTSSRTDLAPPADVSVRGRSMIAVAREGEHSNAVHLPETRKTLALEHYLSAATVNGALWWSNWYERGLLFWTVWSLEDHIDGGQIDLNVDQRLRAALTACYEGNGMRPPWRTGGLPAFDLNQALLHCDSPDELELTRTLANLIPPRISHCTGKARANTPPRLLISPAPDLSCVPWPILPIGGPADSPARLIELYELQFAPSLASIAAAATTDAHQQEPVPYTMCCDYFEPDNFPAPPQRATARFGTAHRRASDPDTLLATPEAVASFLRHLNPGSQGLTVFRTHFSSVSGDPTASGFELYGGTFEVGWLLPHDRQAGRPILGMTSRVLLSCCSTSASQERYGGESLGLVAACIGCGARMIIATSVNIPHTSFTSVFDHLLTEMMLNNSSHVSGLHNLQCQMLREWRNSGGLGIQLGNADIRAPLPVVWAYYQACGPE